MTRESARSLANLSPAGPCKPAKKAGRPEAARQLCPGEGTGQKPTVMPVTKPVPSTLRPFAQDLSAVKIEVFEATPGASV